MKKEDLVREIAKESGQTLAVAEEVFNATFKAIAEQLTKEEVIRVPRFGSFQVKDTAARKGTNPSTGEVIDIPASKRVSFKASSVLKDEVKKA